MADFKKFRKINNLTQSEIAEYFGCLQGFISQIELGRRPIPDEFIKKIIADNSLSGKEYILGYGKSEEIIETKPQRIYGVEDSKGKLIPFYDDVTTIGGANERSANLEAVSQPTDYIDTGDWFRDATAAIRHYGESMVEYPPGCILALKEVYDRELIIPGRDYCIETSEYRVTKRIQKGSDKEHWTAYSTNPSTYADGRLIHEPFEIGKNAVSRIFLVLGYVVKKNGGTMVYSNK